MPLPTHQQHELMKQRANLVEQARELVKRAETENRDLSTEEQEQYDRIMVDVSALKERADRENRLSTLESEMEEAGRQAPQIDLGSAKSTAHSDSPEYRDAFNRYIRTGDFRELRSLQTGDNEAGGYAVSSPTLGTIVEFLTGNNVMRQLLPVQSASGPFSVPVETEQVTVSGVAELGSVLEDQAVLGTATFSPYTLSRITRASLQLLQDSAFDIEAYIARKLGQGTGNEEERLSINGIGSGEPEGILTGGSEGATGGAIAYSGVIDLLYSVVEGYRNRGTFVGSDEVAAAIMKLTDSQNQPIWQPSVQAGQPDRLRGKPFRTSQHMPANASGNKILVFGDFEAAMWLVQYGTQSLQRLDEKYADTNEVGFKIFHRFDTRVVDQRAVKWYRRTS